MPPSPELIRRFSHGERWIHRTLGALMGLCILTAAMLWWAPLSTLVGRRALVETVHVASGLLLPLPLLVGAATSRAFRADIRRLNRFLPGDWAWLRATDRRGGSFPSGKFNAGQKLNAAFVLGAVLALFLTGLMLHWFEPFPDEIRTGATFVHDVIAAAVVVVSAGHLWMASRDPQARAGLRTGYVPREWAKREHALWEARHPPASSDSQVTPPPTAGPSTAD
jgi:formate dehydrogenase subunit gamma